MTDPVTRDDLMRYLDGELSPVERRRVDEALAVSTELRRQLGVFRALKEDLRGISFGPPAPDSSVWDRIRRRLVRPAGWILLVAGAVAWAVYGAYIYLASPVRMAEKLFTAAIVVGILLLLASVIGERYREWLSDPYRDVRR